MMTSMAAHCLNPRGVLVIIAYTLWMIAAFSITISCIASLVRVRGMVGQFLMFAGGMSLLATLVYWLGTKDGGIVCL